MSETPDRSGRVSLPFLASGGEMGARMRALDWSASPLGPPEGWPQSLRSTVSMLLPSRAQIILFWGPEHAVLYNDAYRQVFGAKHPHVLGRPGSEAWSEIWDTQLRELLEGVVRTGEAFWARDLLFELERHGFLEETYFDVSYDPVRVESGAVGGVFCIVTETTERVVGERRLALLRDLAARNATARTVPEACALAIETLAASPADVAFALAWVDGECRSATPGAEARMAAARPDEVVTLPIPSPAGSRESRLVVGINSRRPYDDAYRSFLALVADQLATAVANARAHEEGRQRAEALAAIDRAKTAFFSNVSHEFRTPLTLMMGPLEDLMARTPASSPQDVETLRVIHRNGLRLLKLVNTLLEFSRIEAGRVRARFEPVDLGALTTDLASTFRSAMDQAGLRFTIACDPIDAPVFVDRDMWEQVVLNLVSNAFKFTLHGGVTVRVRAAGDAAVLEVADTGVGIPESELERVFERFHRVEATMGRSHEGSGIGLALVSELVKLHGGRIAVHSRIDEGTTFSVSIPLGSAHLPAAQVAAEADVEARPEGRAYLEEALGWLRQPAAEPAARGASASDVSLNGRVLIADDNADMRDYARRLLSDRWAVETVANGREALHAARACRPDVIVSDVMMPELDGLGLLREVRADAALREIPVILLSARAGEEARIEGVAAGADDYLVKPFSARDLVARVDAQLIKARARVLEQEHARRLVRLFTHAPVAIAILRGPDHVYELTNAHYLELVGGREILGLPIRQALPELEGQGIYELLDRVRASGEPYIGKSLRVHMIRNPGDRLEDAYFDFVYQPTFDDGGHVDAIVVVAHDVTELALAKAEAEEANHSKDEFLATLSHELRTPLNAVLGYTHMLREGMIDAQRLPGVLETIQRNARLQEQLVSDVLDVSRIVTGKLRLEVHPVDLCRVIEDAVQTVAPAATAKGVALQARLDLPGIRVAGDAQRLQQVIWNLLSNAVKFTPRGGRVEVSVERAGAQIAIAVSDTGEGIQADFLPHVFQRFKQADGSFSRTHMGLGLGLAICRHLVEAHGGTITASSAGKGKGATFHVELPLLGTQEQALRGAVSTTAGAPVADALPPVDLAGVRVLLVDDDVDALQMARDALGLSGAEVTTASNAHDALSALDREQFDVGILDLGMPRIDGYELLRLIRSRPDDRQGRIPLAALTAYARTLDRARSLQSGFQLHLTKPVHPGELAAAVLALADRPRARSAPRRVSGRAAGPEGHAS